MNGLPVSFQTLDYSYWLQLLPHAINAPVDLTNEAMGSLSLFSGKIVAQQLVVFKTNLEQFAQSIALGIIV